MERRILKKTGTYADALEAIGTASLLSELNEADVSILDHGSEFLVTTSAAKEPDSWLPPSPGFPYIWESNKEPDRPDLADVLDYQEARKKRDAWIEYEKTHRKRKKIEGELMDQDISPPDQPPPELAPALILASMRKGWNADRDLAKWARANPDSLLEWVRHALGCAPEPPGNLPSFSNSQVLNPISGKGVSGPKTRLRSPGSLPGALVDPFPEWMKFRGLWDAMLLYRSGDDFKLYVLEPADIPIDALHRICSALRRDNLWGGIRLDIVSTLRCAETLIRHSDAAQDPGASRIRLLRRRPRQVLAGLRLAYFKSLGTAAALMNDAFFPLPDWFPINTPEDADTYLGVIHEFIGFDNESGRAVGSLASLDEKNSDDGGVLQQFREWLLTDDPWELMEFLHQFSLHIMQRFAVRQWARPLSVSTLNVLIPAVFDTRYTVKDIIEDEGFQSLARAIRNSTIYAVKLQNREIHFGLAQKWKQRIKAGNQEFAAAVAEFVQTQNWEVTHKLGRGHLVTTAHLDSFLELLESHGAELVGSLLLAYGYARAAKVEEETPSPAE